MESKILDSLFELPFSQTAGSNGGDVIALGSLIGLAINGTAADETGTMSVIGKSEIIKDASAFSAGDKVYWDGTNRLATATASTNQYFGRAIEDASSGGSGTTYVTIAHGLGNS